MGAQWSNILHVTLLIRLSMGQVLIFARDYLIRDIASL